MGAGRRSELRSEVGAEVESGASRVHLAVGLGISCKQGSSSNAFSANYCGVAWTSQGACGGTCGGTCGACGGTFATGALSGFVSKFGRNGGGLGVGARGSSRAHAHFRILRAMCCHECGADCGAEFPQTRTRPQMFIPRRCSRASFWHMSAQPSLGRSLGHSTGSSGHSIAHQSH